MTHKIGAAMEKQEKKRLQFEFTEEANQELAELQVLTALPSKAEVVRHALRFFLWALVEMKFNGGRLILEKDGEKNTVIFPFLTDAGITTARKAAGTAG
jgi:hypothetical protein